MSDSHKTGIALLVLLVAAVGIITGLKFHKYTKEDPSFCTLCHRTEEGYRSWEGSKHFQLICQTCHKISTLEGNKLLMAYYVKGDKSISQEHGRITPWQTCLGCHNQEASQGSITFKSSYGHARHVFMHSMTCDSCHTGSMHALTVESDKCRKCHGDKLVHGMGTAGLQCINCHNFKVESEKLQTSEKCYECHKTLKIGEVMAKLQCHDCHKPHQKLKFQSEDCLGTCHSGEISVGQHRLHIEKKPHMQCLDCHRPHSWRITKERARGLCDRCHRLKDPQTFIY